MRVLINEAVSVIEDLLPLYNIPVTVNLEENIIRAYLVPSGEKLRMKKNGKSIELVIPEFTLHVAVVLEYE